MKNPADTFFRKPAKTVDRINEVKNEIDYLYWLMMPTGIDYARDKIMTTPENVIPEYASHKADLERELKELQKKYLNELKAVKIVICHLRDENEFGASILSEYYLYQKSITRIAENHHYSREGIYKARNKALNQAMKWI